jgi:DNA-binding XRE family transcriptional regulator
MKIYNSKVDNNIIKKLYDYRVWRGMTQTQIANAMGVTKQTVHRIENCKHSPTLKTLNSYILALGVSYEISVFNNKDMQ